jgi:cell wall-associated NlpC family hydrolase
MGVTAASLTAILGLTLIPAITTGASAGTMHAAAKAGTTHSATHRRRARSAAHARRVREVRVYDKRVRQVLKEASRQRGKPYVYGAAGPHAFDCSGLVRFVFGHALHRWLPHNAAQQYHSLHHIKRKNLRRGDLIFTDNGYVSHVGIFAGHHHWWVAPHTGTHVQKQRIYHAHFVYARVIRKYPRH